MPPSSPPAPARCCRSISSIFTNCSPASPNWRASSAKRRASGSAPTYCATGPSSRLRWTDWIDLRMPIGEELMATKPQVIALEEHYFDPEVRTHVSGLDATTVPRIVERLAYLGALG